MNKENEEHMNSDSTNPIRNYCFQAQKRRKILEDDEDKEDNTIISTRPKRSAARKIHIIESDSDDQYESDNFTIDSFEI